MSDRRLQRVAVWNMKVGRGRAAIDGLLELIEDTDPDAILLQEAMNYVQRIRKEFGHEWRVYSGRAFTEGANCPVMIRRDIPHGGVEGVDWGIVRNKRTWIYRGKGRFVTHKGRRWVWAVGDGVPLMSIHRATEALGYNQAAGEQEARRLTRWLNKRPVAFVAGDFNNLWSDKRTHSPRDIAQNSGAELAVPAEARIDYALVKGIDVRAKRGKRYGSDHHSHTYELR